MFHHFMFLETAMPNTVYASYNGSQKGFTVRDLRLNQTFFLNTGFDISGIAAGPNSDVYLTSANNIYHYKADGTLLQKMTFPDTGIKYIGITATSDRVYATYTGSQVGVTVRDLNLNQLSCFGTAFTASGIAAGGGLRGRRHARHTAAGAVVHDSQPEQHGHGAWQPVLA